MSYHWQYPCQPYPQRCRKKKTKYYDSSDDEDNLSRGSCGPYVNAPPMYPPMYPHMMHPQMQQPQMYPQMNPYINPHTHSPMHFSMNHYGMGPIPDTYEEERRKYEENFEAPNEGNNGDCDSIPLSHVTPDDPYSAPKYDEDKYRIADDVTIESQDCDSIPENENYGCEPYSCESVNICDTGTCNPMPCNVTTPCQTNCDDNSTLCSEETKKDRFIIRIPRKKKKKSSVHEQNNAHGHVGPHQHVATNGQIVSHNPHVPQHGYIGNHFHMGQHFHR